LGNNVSILAYNPANLLKYNDLNKFWQRKPIHSYLHHRNDANPTLLRQTGVSGKGLDRNIQHGSIEVTRWSRKSLKWYRIGSTLFVTIAKLSRLEGKALEAFKPMQPRRKKRCDAFMP